MARPWEYPRWRRVVMQVGMWVILCATLGLAQLVSHSRGQSEAAKQLGPFLVRLPAGWKTDVANADQLDAHDPQDERKVSFIARPMRSVDSVTEYRTAQRIRFSGLGRYGYWEPTTQIHLSPGVEQEEPVLMAVVSVPSVGMRLELILGVEDVTLTAGDVSLLNRLAAGVTLASTPPKSRQIGPGGGG